MKDKRKLIVVILSVVLLILLIIIGVSVSNDVRKESAGNENVSGSDEEMAENGNLEAELDENTEKFEEPDNYVKADEVYETEKNAEEKEFTERIELAEQNQGTMVLVSNTSAKPGDTVEVTANLVNNPGVLGMMMTLSYDESVLELVSAKSGEAFKDVLTFTTSKELGNGCVFLWDGESVEESEVKDGSILTLEFKVNKSAEAKKVPISLICSEGGTIDGKLKEIEVVVENGYIVIGK